MPEDVRAWFASRVPGGWFVAPPEVTEDGEEILVVGTLADVELAKGTAGDGPAAAPNAPIQRVCEESPGGRIRLAPEAQGRVRREDGCGGRRGGERKELTTRRR